jgi:hypothetical protein
LKSRQTQIDGSSLPAIRTVQLYEVRTVQSISRIISSSKLELVSTRNIQSPAVLTAIFATDTNHHSLMWGKCMSQKNDDGAI